MNRKQAKADISGRFLVYFGNIKYIGPNDPKELFDRVGNSVCSPLAHCSFRASTYRSSGDSSAQAVNDLIGFSIHAEKYSKLNRQSTST